MREFFSTILVVIISVAVAVVVVGAAIYFFESRLGCPQPPVSYVEVAL